MSRTKVNCIRSVCSFVTEEDDSQQMELCASKLAREKRKEKSEKQKAMIERTIHYSLFTLHFGNANQVFPPQWDDEMSDDDVVNYATGMFGQWPTLLCMDDSHELLVLRDGRLETQHWQPASMCNRKHKRNMSQTSSWCSSRKANLGIGQRRIR